MPDKKFREDVDSAINKYVVDPLKSAGTRLKDVVMGTEEENAKATKEMAEAAKKYPEGLEAKYKKMMGKEATEEASQEVITKKAGGKISSASKRADGCCVKGKTRGRMV